MTWGVSGIAQASFGISTAVTVAHEYLLELLPSIRHFPGTVKKYLSNMNCKSGCNLHTNQTGNCCLCCLLSAYLLPQISLVQGLRLLVLAGFLSWLSYRMFGCYYCKWSVIMSCLLHTHSCEEIASPSNRPEWRRYCSSSSVC